MDLVLSGARALLDFDWNRITGIATSVLALGTFLLAWSTWRMSRLTRRSVDLQAEEVRLFKRQLELAEAQAEAARVAAMPKIRLQPAQRGGALYVEGAFVWAHGTGPAYNLEVWIRGREGLRVATLDFMTPSDREVRFMALPASPEDQERLPFPHFTEEVLDETQTWVGARWDGPDGTQDGFSEKITGRPAAGDDEGFVVEPPATRIPGPGPTAKTPV